MLLTFCFIVCENFYPEVEASVRQQGLTNVIVRSYPSHCCASPLNWSELAGISDKVQADVTVISGSYCLRALELPPEKAESCRIRLYGQCHHLLLNPTLVDALQRNGTYLLSPGWLSRWQSHVRVWGFDRATAAEFFGESLRRLLLLDTGIDPKAQQHLAAFGDFLHLPTETLAVGLEFLDLRLSGIIAEYRQQELLRQKSEIERQAAETAMTLDLIRMVTRAKSKPEVVSGITELFTMLFDPEKIDFIPVRNGEMYYDRSSDLTADEQELTEQFYAGGERYLLLDEKQGSFFLRIGRKEKVSALLLISRVAYPQYVHQYINTALALSEVCALAIEHVQTLRELVRTSHLAGKAEVATEVLHNVGNTLNSISVSSEHIRELVQQSSSSTLPTVVQLIEEHKEELANFCAHDPRGQRLPTYFAKLSEKMAEERELLVAESTRQLHHIRRITEIIRAQQDTAKLTHFTAQINLNALLEESLELFQGDLQGQGIVVERQFDFQESMSGEPHKILQVINNLIRNAVDAFAGTSVERKIIILNTYPSSNREKVIVEVRDNGKGMAEKVLQQAFTFGFTTKRRGHGFGLHNAANLTAEMGGSLSGESAGLEQGATFRMVLPVTATGRTE
ncbi:MAG: ATP-binding protein [Candidatus Electrothrix aestuarii]|uniref:histidine kinase n=1 Tax=Candidatus Electrothrix aestuarii TaxID=3062594 RepID=A0AAU8LQM9_9BACT|nr:ATP-binding protein [Candidatus Electrothrix aestuarii]